MSSHPFTLPEPYQHPHLVANYRRQPVQFVKGEGCWLIDTDGQRFLDGLSGIAVNALGHNDPDVTKAICEQAGQLLHTSNVFHIGPQEELADLLCAHSFGEQVFFCNSGAEANEAAYKVVKRYGNVTHHGRKPRIIAAEHSFHGRTMAAISMTGTPAYHEGFEPMLPVEFVPYGDSTALQNAMGDDVAGLWLEPLQGEGGVVVPPSGYLQRARELCDQHQALLVFDEVQTGCGRCGSMFAHQLTGVQPDLMALAKGLGGGVPIGALVATAAAGSLLVPGTHASTFGGNHLACAAGVAVLKRLTQPGFLAQVAQRGEQLRSGLQRVLGQHALEVRGRGLLVGVQLAPSMVAADVLAAALRQGLVSGVAGGNVWRFAPPLVISEDEIEELLSRVAATIATMETV